MSIEYRRHAKSQCMPSSREMSSFEKVRPGIRPRFFSQKMAQKEPEERERGVRVYDVWAGGDGGG